MEKSIPAALEKRTRTIACKKAIQRYKERLFVRRKARAQTIGNRNVKGLEKDGQVAEMFRRSPRNSRSVETVVVAVMGF